MPIKYVGRTTDFCGKTLWEIVGNLKNYGVGRLVYRQRFQRYPEPCFLRILKVLPVLHDGNTSNPHENYRKVIVYVENIFRGRRDPVVKEILSASYKPDYRLIPKHEEQEWLKRTEEVDRKIEYIDPYVDMPPLLKKLVTKELDSTNQTITADKLKLKLSFKSDNNNLKRAADEEHPATIRFETLFGTPLMPQLYEIKDEVKKAILEKRPY